MTRPAWRIACLLFIEIVPAPSGSATWGGILSRFDEKTNTFVQLHAPSWVTLTASREAASEPFTKTGPEHSGWRRGWACTGSTGSMGRSRATRKLDGLPSNDLMGILEDAAGRLWISSKKGISRFDPRTKTFRNYDVSDGLPSNDFCAELLGARAEGEMFFCGNGGITAFFPEAIRDDPYVPPVVITSLTVFNKPVRIGADSVLKRAIPYVESLTLPYEDNVFSLEFAALSYANSHKNRYRYRLEGFDPGWNEVDSRHRLATYTNLDPGHYVFRVQGSNSDGVWNEAGVSLPIRDHAALVADQRRFAPRAVGCVLALLWAAYQFRMRQVQHAFDMTLEARVGERTRIARELHDTLLQSFHGLLLRFQTASYLLPERPAEAKEKLDERDSTGGEGDHRRPGRGAGLAGVDRRTQRSRGGDQNPWRRARDRRERPPASGLPRRGRGTGARSAPDRS